MSALSKWGLINDLYLVRKAFQGSLVCNFLITAIPLLALVTFSLIW